MKKLATLIFTCISLFSLSQINVGSKEWGSIRKSELKEENIAKLRKTQTVFVYKNSDKENLELFKQTLDDAWDFTELIFVDYNEFVEEEWDQNEYSFFQSMGCTRLKHLVAEQSQKKHI